MSRNNKLYNTLPRVYFRISLKRGQIHSGGFQEGANPNGGNPIFKYREANCQGQGQGGGDPRPLPPEINPVIPSLKYSPLLPLQPVPLQMLSLVSSLHLPQHSQKATKIDTSEKLIKSLKLLYQLQHPYYIDKLQWQRLEFTELLAT